MNLNFEHVTLVTYLAVYAAGLVTSLTPCVYPLMPVVVGYLGTRSGGWGPRLTASGFYALGLATVYSLLGMLAALTGSLFGALTTNPWVYLAFGIFMLFLGGGMMDWYQIPLLNGARADVAGGRWRESRVLGPFLVGASSGLVASPCTAPVLATLLAFVAGTKAILTGGLLLLAFSLGLSTLLLSVGLVAGAAGRLPRSGGWMVAVKKTLAAVLLGAGVYFIFAAGRLA